MEALIERLVSEQPHFHAWPDGRSANWSVASDALRFLFEQVRPGMNVAPGPKNDSHSACES